MGRTENWGELLGWQMLPRADWAGRLAGSKLAPCPWLSLLCSAASQSQAADGVLLDHLQGDLVAKQVADVVH